MRNLYFGKFNNQFFLYLDPLSIDFLQLIKRSNYVVCNELLFDGDKEISVSNSILTATSFISLLKNNKPLTEFNLIIDNKLHLENIWWDDVLIISNFETIIAFIYDLRAQKNTECQKLLDLMLSKPETYLSIDNNKIKEKSIPAIDFISFIKDSDRYIEKEKKFVNNHL
jgi:hypothetical protein